MMVCVKNILMRIEKIIKNRFIFIWEVKIIEDFLSFILVEDYED